MRADQPGVLPELAARHPHGAPLDRELTFASRDMSLSAGHEGKHDAVMTADEVREHSLQVSDGRTVAWTECGDENGLPVLRIPGTPGCRWSIRWDRSPWLDRSLRMITTERPGYGASSRLPGRGFAEPAADMVQILDHLGLDGLHVYGSSGAGPHILALTALYPERVRAVTVLAGAAPLTDSEAEHMIEINIRSRRLALDRDVEGLHALLDPIREAQVTDPLGAFRTIMSEAPPDDQSVMADPLWQQTLSRAMTEALGQGSDGWIDECVAMYQSWSDFDVADIRSSLTWWHTSSDRNAPLSAAQRLVAGVPNAQLNVWPDGGHFAAYHREGEVLDELLARG